MTMRWNRTAWLLSFAGLLLSLPVAAGQAYRMDLVGGMALRSTVGDRVQLDSPGGGLQLDFGRHLGAGFWLLGSLSWTRFGGGPAEEKCSSCPQTETADTFVTGLLVRYALPFSGFEMFVQAGPGYLVDILDRSGDNGENAPAGFHQQPAFVGGLGLGFSLTRDVSLGLRVNALFGTELDAMSMGCYAGYRFSYER